MRKSIAIVSIFKHHSKFAGYKNVLRFTKPIKTFGIDYTKNPPAILRAHYFFHEFIARIKTIGLKFDILHILYGEDYYRFSRLLFPFKKIVVTFHQPPVILEQELDKGNYNGRIAGFTHSLTRRRIRKLDAAIVMTDEQKQIAKKYIPEEKIHVIPLGVELNSLNKIFNEKKNLSRNKFQLITVGEWQRDWDMYLKYVEYASKHFTDLKFILVNKNINEQVKMYILNCSNVEFKDNIDNQALYNLYSESLAMFLPLKSAAGNNALNEGLALGCPVISNITFPHLNYSTEFVFNFSNENEFLENAKHLSRNSEEERASISQHCNSATQAFSWENVSSQLIELYNKL